MKSLIVLCVAVAAVLADGPVNYHAEVGIPLAAKIKAAEEAGQAGSRIIGGQPSPLGSHPYMVGIVVTLAGGSISACGSSMLSNTNSITAAHCWVDAFSQAQLFTLVFGSQYIFSGGVRIDTTNVDVHPGWNSGYPIVNDVNNDIAIITHSFVTYTNLIRPINLPSGNLLTNNFVGWSAQATGFGMIGDGIPLVPGQYKRSVTLQVISNEQCRNYYSTFITDKVLCTDGQGPVGVCSSDSGGPLSVVYNEQPVLIGVVSFGSVRCEQGWPSGFVRITAHLPWIQQRINE